MHFLIDTKQSTKDSFVLLSPTNHNYEIYIQFITMFISACFFYVCTNRKNIL